MRWDLYIEKTQNGYILTNWDEDIDLEGEPLCNERKRVIEEIDNIEREEEDLGLDTEQIAMKRLLYQIADHFGHMYDKYKENNLKIDFSYKGHKYIGDEENEEETT